MVGSAHDGRHSEGIDRDRVPRHEVIEEVAQRRVGHHFRPRAAPDLVHILTGHARSDLAKLDAFPLAPAEEPRHETDVIALRVAVGDRRL